MLHIIPAPPYYKMSPLKDPTLAAQIVFGLVILIIALHLALPRFVNNSFHIIPVPPYYHIVPVLLHIIPVHPYYKMSPLKDPKIAAQIVFGLDILITALHLALPRFINNSF